MAKKKKTMTVELIGYEVTGWAQVSLWGGGTGEITMDKTFLPEKHFSKDNVLRCVNDGGFGVESIDFADVIVEEVYENGARGKDIRFETGSTSSRKLFLGWRHLREIGAIK